ncbi:hypothetical protein [Deinococcus apachensis]|uniref:hypothetical protein n=1 Tax=Deinococcus apachensis TaxID=309886 RepID=UPI00035F46BB|nr:hypothetical protein [Deinococcus apachensis]
MPYARLSEQVQKLSNPQRSDTFVKQFRNAVRDGEVDAAEVPGRFTLPKEFKKRGSDETSRKEVKEMVFEVTPAFEAWFERVDAELATAPTRGSGKPKVTVENIEAGAVDFKALAEETRRKMQASFEKGQALGNARKAGAAKAKPKRGARSKK